MKSGKVWGSTEAILVNSFCEVHRIEAKKGGVCSKHKHQYKTNLFYVESGKLKITTWKTSYNLADVTILTAGEYTQVAPNELHQFEALEDTVAFEVYFPQPIGDDIVRENVGYKKEVTESVELEKSSDK